MIFQTWSRDLLVNILFLYAAGTINKNFPITSPTLLREFIEMIQILKIFKSIKIDVYCISLFTNILILNNNSFYNLYISRTFLTKFKSMITLKDAIKRRLKSPLLPT